MTHRTPMCKRWTSKLKKNFFIFCIFYIFILFLFYIKEFPAPLGVAPQGAHHPRRPLSLIFSSRSEVLACSGPEQTKNECECAPDCEPTEHELSRTCARNIYVFFVCARKIEKKCKNAHICIFFTIAIRFFTQICISLHQN